MNFKENSYYLLYLMISNNFKNILKMSTPNNMDEGKPIKPEEAIDIEVSTEDSTKYIIKIWTFQDKLYISTSYKKGIIIKEYFSSFYLEKLIKNKNYKFEDINEYFHFLKCAIENSKKMKELPKLKKLEIFYIWKFLLISEKLRI